MGGQSRRTNDSNQFISVHLIYRRIGQFGNRQVIENLMAVVRLTAPDTPSGNGAAALRTARPVPPPELSRHSSGGAIMP